MEWQCIRVFNLSNQTFRVQFLRDLKQCFGVSFKIKPDASTQTILMACVGIGYVNHNKKAT